MCDAAETAKESGLALWIYVITPGLQTYAYTAEPARISLNARKVNSVNEVNVYLSPTGEVVRTDEKITVEEPEWYFAKTRNNITVTNPKKYAIILRKLALEEEQLNRGIDSLLDCREPALKYINQLKGDEYTVIYRYYIIGQTWEKIAAEIYFSERKVYLNRRSALNKLEKIYNLEVQNGQA